MRPDRRVERVYLHRAPIDMRRQMDGLAALVQGVMQKDPFTDSLFVFINRRRNKLKILTWEKNGFVICTSGSSGTNSFGQSRRVMSW